MRDLTLAICMYNAEKYIEETLSCIMDQTVQDFHLLILNDCSTDGSSALVRSFFEKHPRQYELIDLPQNRGLCCGRRFVEEHASTKYLLFVDADDRPLPMYVEKLYDCIDSDDELMAVGCYMEYIDLTGKKTKGGVFVGPVTKEEFRKKAENEKLLFMASTSIYDRELALSVGGHNIEGFPEGKPRYQDFCEDLDLWTRMSDLYKQGKAIVVLPQILYQYRKGDGMSMSSFNMMLRMRHVKINLKRRRRNRPELTFIEFCEQLSAGERRKIERKAISADSLRAAYYNLRRGKLLSSVKELYRSVSNDPGYIMDKLKHNLLRIK